MPLPIIYTIISRISILLLEMNKRPGKHSGCYLTCDEKGGIVLTAPFVQHSNSKKQHSQNYKVKNIQVEDEIIDISGWSISPCYCHLEGQGFVPCCLINSSASQQGATVEPSRVNLDPTGVSTFHLLATETICLLLHMRGFLVPT